jgi:hypothetical protein
MLGKFDLMDAIAYLTEQPFRMQISRRPQDTGGQLNFML